MGENEALPGELIFIDGEPVDGIRAAEIALDPTDYAPEEPLRTADNVELSLTFTPEQAAAIVERLKSAIEEVARKLREFAEWAREVIRKVAAAAITTANDFMDCLLYGANDNPRWWHLYKHAKKYRTRKKYRRLLMKQLIRKLEAAQKYKEVRA